MRYPEVAFRLPGWVDEVIPDPARIYPTVDDRMGVVIELAHQNVQRGTGGPFAAAVFDARRHTLVAPGVNMVVPMGYSVAHGEVMAIVIAQHLIGTHHLGGAGLPPSNSSRAPNRVRCVWVPFRGQESGGWPAARGTRMPAPWDSMKGTSPPTGPGCWNGGALA